MSYTRSIESYCSDGSIQICYGVDGDESNRDSLLSVASIIERFLDHASNRKLVPKLNMLLDTFGRGDHSLGTNVLISAQANIDGSSLDMVIEFRINRRLSERQTRLVKSYITSHLIRDAFDSFADTIGEMIFEGSLYTSHDELALSST